MGMLKRSAVQSPGETGLMKRVRESLIRQWPILAKLSNVFHLVMGHPPVMGHYFTIVKSKKIYNHQPTIAFNKLRFSSVVVLHLLIVYI